MLGNKFFVGLIDDSKTVHIQVYESFHQLQTHQYQVVGIDKDSCFDIIHHYPIDIFLIDLHLDGFPMGGYDFARYIRRNPVTKNKPILFITSNTDPSVRVRARAAGANSFIPKPFSFQQLLSKINELLLIELQDKFSELIYLRLNTQNRFDFKKRSDMQHIIQANELLLEEILASSNPQHRKSIHRILALNAYAYYFLNHINKSILLLEKAYQQADDLLLKYIYKINLDFIRFDEDSLTFDFYQSQADLRYMIQSLTQNYHTASYFLPNPLLSILYNRLLFEFNLIQLSDSNEKNLIIA